MSKENGERTVAVLLNEPFPDELVVERSPVSMLDVVTWLALRKRFIAKATLGAAVAGTILAFLIPNRYDAEVKILPPQQAQSSAAALLSSLSNSAMGALAASAGKDLGLKSTSELYIGLLKTRPVADALIHRFDLQKVYRAKTMEDTRKSLARSTEIVVGKDGFISVSVEDKDKKRAAAMANAYIEEVRNLSKGLALTESSARRSFYEEQLKQAKEDLANAEIEFKQAQQRSGIIQVDAQAKVLIESIGTLRAHLAAKQVELQALRSYATDQNADVAMVQHEIAGIQTELNRLERQNPGTDSYEFSLKNAPESGLAYIRAFREVKYRETLFELLARQYEAARIDEARDAPVIQVVEPAIEPERKSFPHRGRIILLSAALGCFVACLVVIIGVRQSQAKTDPRYAARLLAFRKALFSK